MFSLLQKVSCADTNVGDAKVRGVSGGEKKRLSLACELIASPSVIFADEPTTGKQSLASNMYWWMTIVAGICFFLTPFVYLIYTCDSSRA